MSIPQDDNANLSNSMNEEDAEAALMASFEKAADNANDDPNDDDADEGDDGEQEQAADQEDADDAEEGDEGDDQEEGDDADTKAAKAPAVTDEAEVEVTVNGEAQKFTIGALKRLAGQEAALTQKSQEAELVGGRAAAALQAAIEAVQEDLSPYEDVDWMILQQQLDPEEFAWHRENAAKAQKRLNKLVLSAQGFEQTIKDRQTADTARAAEACQREMKADVPDWSDKLHADIKAFGVKEGLPEADMAAITNPKVLKLLRKAMLFDQGKAVATEKVKAAPTKVLRGNARQEPAKAASTKKAESRLARSGSDTDAVAVLMGRWA